MRYVRAPEYIFHATCPRSRSTAALRASRLALALAGSAGLPLACVAPFRVSGMVGRRDEPAALFEVRGVVTGQ